MDLALFINDKTHGTKEKTEQLAQWLLESVLTVAALIKFADTSKGAVKAICMEALEHATKINPAVADKDCLCFAVLSLKDNEPRVKWESARVIGNIAHLFPRHIDAAVRNLLENTGHKGTVVRWSAAFALGEIIKIKTALNMELIPTVTHIIEQEEKNSIRKIYLAAIKKAGEP
jgi:hypothetical protein